MDFDWKDRFYINLFTLIPAAIKGVQIAKDIYDETLDALKRKDPDAVKAASARFEANEAEILELLGKLDAKAGAV
ncbi:MAG: hypothetical protein K2X87_25500 [Gemmataceae bacterium]|nr:hypothetical protein [Gemmataceae bacterium]